MAEENVPLFIVGEVNVPLFIVGEVNVLFVNVWILFIVANVYGVL